MSKLTGAALDRAVANALGLKSVNNCEKWSSTMDEDDDDIQDYKKPWVGLTHEKIKGAIDDGFAFGLNDGNVSNKYVIRYARVIEAKLRSKNNG